MASVARPIASQVARGIAATLNAGVGIGPGSIAVHSRYVALGDSITSLSASKGFLNWTMFDSGRLGGRLRPAIGADQGIGGNTMTQILARIGYTTSQKPDIVFEMSGHNDGFTAGATETLITRKRAILNGLRSPLPSAVIVALAALPSSSGSEDADVLAAFNADIAAWVQADRRSIYVPVPTGWDTDIHTYDGTHPNIAGAVLIAQTVYDAVSPYMAEGDVLLETTASGFHGANLDPEYSLAGTGGTKTGTTTPTGNVATGKEVTNSTDAAVACSKGTRGSDATQIIQITGTPTSEANVTFDEASGSSIATGGAIGDYFEYLVGVKITATDGVSASAGLKNMLVGGTGMGTLGNNATDANNTTALAEAMDCVFRTIPTVLLSTNTVVPNVIARMASGVAADAQVEIYRPIVRKTELVAYATPFYVGNDGIKAAVSTVRITGTAQSGQALTGGPGDWSGGACAMTYQWKRYNAGTNAFDSDIPGATSQTYTVQAGDIGFKIGLTVTATNSFGATSQASALTATVT
jgi:lysophospholipase L1-like esterase